MSIQPWCNAAARTLLGLMCMAAVGLVACGGGDDRCGDLVCDGDESATSCPSDCGCGNGMVDPGEACDGDDLAGATCMDTVQRGGTLACNADCTLDVSACNLASCGNGMVEEAEACDGADLGGRTCAAIGYAGGELGCSMDCVFDTTTCCTNNCSTDGLAECVGDTLRLCAAEASGCLAWQITDCAATGNVCQSAAPGAAACTCIDACALGDMRCEGAMIETCAEVAGCLQWTPTTDCAADGGICAVAPSGPLCAPDASAESCAEPFPLSPGPNVVAWSAASADYLLDVSCDTSTLTGPDLVLSYTAPETGLVNLTVQNPSSAEHVIVVSAEACGATTPEHACFAGSDDTLTTEFAVTAGTTYFAYLRDTTSGTAPLDNPLFVTLEETRCSAITPGVTTQSPSNGASIPDLTPIFTADTDLPIDPGAGVITVTGNLGTNLIYDLTTGPAEIAIINDGKTLLIDPGIVFPKNETVTVSWTGLVDAICGEPIAPPAWTFEVSGPPCAPGVDGMVGTTITRLPTGLSSFTEQSVAADDDPNGFVYVGGLSNLYRMPKAGGTVQDVEAAAGLVSTNLGYDTAIVGSEIFSLESDTSAFTDVLWRLSTDAGATWSVQNYVQFPQTPNDDLRAVTFHAGRLYMATAETSAGTQIWSVAASSQALPEAAVLEATLGEDSCTGLAVDDQYYYLACSTGDRLVRVDRVTLTVELVTDTIDLNSTKNELQIHDLDADGRADVLYVSSYHEEVHYVCEPNQSAAPFFVDVLVNFGGSTTNYGLGFDRASNVLWMFDDDTREFIKIE